MNWTTLQLQVDATGAAHAATSQAVEQLARRAVQDAVSRHLGRVPVTADVTVASLLVDPGLGDALSARTSRWVVREVTYFSSGRVDLRAELSVQDALKPYTLQIARADEDAGGHRYSGLLVDARGTSATPAFAPRIVDGEGRSLYAGELHQTVAVRTAPFVYVTDPAHPAAVRVGDAPLIVTVTRAAGSELTVSAGDAALLADAAGFLGSGRVVVVLDD